MENNFHIPDLEKNNSHTVIQFYIIKIEIDDKQRPNLQKNNQSIYYELKHQLHLSLNQSDEGGTNIKYFNEDDQISNTNSKEENAASHNHNPMNRRSKIKTNKTKQQNNRNTWKPSLIVSIDNIVRQSVEEYMSSKRQYEERPMVHWPSMHYLLLFKDRRIDDDAILNRN
ncbi:uncharacterized protein LOC134688125 [Mytilus trossulus]|uniref:uncharacterized protein LOC134688125 n=1 Tax=Mytilus trossulus TaxID=6551 RepID=UPI00300439B7